MGAACACVKSQNETLDDGTTSEAGNTYIDENKADKGRKIRELQDQVTKLMEDKATLQQYAETLRRENNKLRESSNDLTKKMAKLSSSDPRIENTSDETSPMQLGTLSDSIYANDWFKAFESLNKTEKNELKILEFLSNIMQTCYKKCRSTSEATLRQFLLLQEEETLPNDDEAKQLLQLRRSMYHKKDRLDHTAKKITYLILEELKNITTNANSPDDPLSQYVSRCTVLCWLVVTSFPQLYLEFEVKNIPYKDVQSRFQTYAAGSPVICDSKDAKECVALVVWPALLTNDRAGFYKKGIVLVYDKTESAV